MRDLPEPTPKSLQIESLITQLSPTGMSRQEAHANSLCPFCGKEIQGFRDNLSVTEYRISGLCQSCQDETFGE